MARIFPIKGIMYNSELDNDLGKFLCPPFDVVDDNDTTERETKEDDGHGISLRHRRVNDDTSTSLLFSHRKETRK